MRADWVRELKHLLGPRGVLESATRRLSYESDALAMLAVEPLQVLLPANTAECASAMRWLHEHELPVVARGAGTGLAGGATPVAGGVVVSLARMRRVLEIDTADRWARVEAGLVNIDLSHACAPHGLFYAPDPSSQQACTLGGNVANNSGGPHCFKHGNTSRHVRGLLVVQHDGELLDLTEPLVDPLGYDLVGLFTGSEGTFGLATELVLNLVPQPPVTETLLSIHTSLDQACDAVSEMIAARLEPSAIEILDRLTIQAVEASVYAAGYPQQAQAVLLVESEGLEDEVSGLMERVRAIARAHGAIEVRTARDAHERKQLWAGRKGAFGAMGRIAPDLYVADAVVPRTKLRELVAYSIQVAAERGLRLATVFHAGDGNLHPNICYDRRDPDETRRVLEAGDLILRRCVAEGGALTGEHGVGLEKLAGMELMFRPQDLERMCSVRDVWDPQRRLNPGKLIPSHACLEIRGWGS